MQHEKRILFGLVALQGIGYTSLWALLHLPNILPTVDNGWFTPHSPYAALVARLSLIVALERHPNIAGLLLLSNFALLSVCYTGSVALARRWPITLSTITLLACTAVLGLPLLFLPHLFSSDVYSYALFGRIPLLYHGNPFVDPPARFPTDPLVTSIYWKTTASVYGPAWIITSLPITALAQALGGSAGVYVLLYKLLAFGSHLASLVVIRRLLLAWRPERATWGPIMYGWHPLVLIEFVGSGHNDSLMVLLILLALLLAHRQRRLFTVLVLVLAGLVKLVALALIPLYILYTLRTATEQRLPLSLKQMAVGIAVVVALYTPFWVGPATLAILRTAPPLTLLHDSPADWVATQLTNASCTVRQQRLLRLEPSQGPPPSAQACSAALQTKVRLASLTLFLVTFAGLVVWPLSSFDQLLERSAWLFLAYTLLAAVHFEPWYVTWLLALTPLLRRPPVMFLLWGCALLLLYSVLPIPGKLLLAYAPLGIQALLVIRPRHGHLLHLLRNA